MKHFSPAFPLLVLVSSVLTSWWLMRGWTAAAEDSVLVSNADALGPYYVAFAIHQAAVGGVFFFGLTASSFLTYLSWTSRQK